MCVCRYKCECRADMIWLFKIRSFKSKVSAQRIYDCVNAHYFCTHDIKKHTMPRQSNEWVSEYKRTHIQRIVNMRMMMMMALNIFIWNFTTTNIVSMNFSSPQWSVGRSFGHSWKSGGILFFFLQNTHLSIILIQLTLQFPWPHCKGSIKSYHLRWDEQPHM